MKKQGIYEKNLLDCVGGEASFFICYYFLTKEVFNVNSFKWIAILPSIYFGIAVLIFPKSGDIVSNKVKNYIIDSKLIMPLDYIFASMIYVFLLKKN